MRQFLLRFRPIVLGLLGQKRYLALRKHVLTLLGKRYANKNPADEKAANHDEILASGITFSIIVPIHDTPEPFLRQCLQSVYDQTYPNWELILVDDKSSASHIVPLLKDAARNSDRIKTVLRTENGNISKAMNSGLEVASGDYVTVLDHDDLLHPAALYWMTEMLLRHPDADYLYSDEDKTDKRGKKFYDAFLKPSWSPELTLQCMYSCHMSVYHTERARQIEGFRSEFDGAQDFDFMLRFTSQFNQIVHVPKVLYHWRKWDQSTAQSLDAKPEAFLRQRRAITEHLSRLGDTYEISDHAIPGHHRVMFHPRRNDKVSIIIPTANKSAQVNGKLENHAEGVVSSVVEHSTYDNYEILLVHDGNFTEEQLERFEKFRPLRLVEYRQEETFNYSEKVNLGAANAAGDFLLLLNDDTRVITPTWLERMLGMAQREGIGAVGAKLLFPNARIQHSGIWLRGNVPGHIDYNEARDTIGYDLSGSSNRNCIAVTAACQLTPRSVFDALGGYNTEFPLNYNDVDYCFRLHERGLRSVCLNYVELYHYEGASRTGGQAVSTEEIERFLEIWSKRIPVDPYLPSNLV